ncbi:MAG TPA: hypothetical protein VLQ68_00400 [Rhizobiaceae bacterium]|nr:hypothetical protein [Rhizobiaceae bacterium]
MNWSGFNNLLFMSAGGIIWAARFVVAYSIAALSCAKGFQSATLGGYPLANALIVGATVVAMAGAAIVFVLAVRRIMSSGESVFVPWVAAGVALLGALAMLWESFVLFLPACS